MDKKSLTTSMMRFCGGSSFIRRGQLASFLGYRDAHNCDKYLVDLQRVGGSLFYIPDVCDRILNS